QAQFVWAVLRNAFHYSAVCLAEIADTARDVDFAMRWGYGNKQGPFELWQAAGWLETAQAVQADIEAGKALSKAPLPDWVFKGPVADKGGVHQPEGSWSAAEGKFKPQNELAVYKRQFFRESVLGSNAPDATTFGKTL